MLLRGQCTMKTCTSLLVFLFISSVCCLKHDLTIKDDSRSQFKIESFGMDRGGVLEMTITDWKVDGQPWDTTDKDEVAKAAFIVKITQTDSTTFLDDDLEETRQPADFFDEGDTSNYPIFRNESGPAFTYKKIVVGEESQGFYNTHFINGLGKPVSFRLQLEQYNVDSRGNRSYLSAGMAQLPAIFGVFTAVYFVMTFAWAGFFMRGKDRKINKVHHLMTSFLVLKFLSLLFQAIDMHFMKTLGTPGGWAIVYYIFAGLKTMMFFVLVALIGSGFFFIRPFLTDKDKKILMVVIPLQVLSNIALIVLDETAPGSQSWITWKDIFKIVDIICCCAVLIPILWSIRHLREASEIDGKAALNLQKLKLFQQFYLIVISYIYFTRIIVYLLDATLPFRYVWLGETMNEIAAFVFFCAVGYKFRPASDNPYFKMATDEDTGVDMEELGAAPPARERQPRDSE